MLSKTGTGFAPPRSVAQEFQGLPVRSLATPHLALEVLAGEGPHVVRAFLPGRPENLLAEVPGMTWETPWGTYRIRGGHRLWHAPEAFPRSYVPEQPATLEETEDGGLRITAEPEPGTGIRKALEVRLDAQHAAATLTHVLTNEGQWPVVIAPWAITQLPLGGTAVVPATAPEKDDFTPNRSLVLWPYTRWEDPRLVMSDDWLVVRGAPAVRPLKVGIFAAKGWAGYLRAGVLFIKRSAPRPGARFPDRGANVEIYCYDEFLELETLGAASRLSPGESATHEERWEWYVEPESARMLEGIRALAASPDAITS